MKGRHLKPQTHPHPQWSPHRIIRTQNPCRTPQFDGEDEELGKLAVRLANGVILPMVLRTALEPNLIDILAAAGDAALLSPTEIAAQLPAGNPNAPVLLDRVLRLLASYSILRCSLRTLDNGEVERLYGVGPICKFFTRNPDGGSIGPLFMLVHNERLTQSWYHLKDAILEGGVPFQMAHGIGWKSNRALFYPAMSNHTTLIMNRIVEIYRGFEGLKVLVDVGGNMGICINIITSKYPHIKGINYDLPDVVAAAPSYSGVEHVGGDMFESVPKGDAIFLKWVLHNWSDEQCVKLLTNCFEALPQDGKVIIVEYILPVAPENSVSANISFELDLMMLVMYPGGRERTQREYENLALKSGFSGCKVVCSAYNSCVMEFSKTA